MNKLIAKYKRRIKALEVEATFYQKSRDKNRSEGRIQIAKELGNLIVRRESKIKIYKMVISDLEDLKKESK